LVRSESAFAFCAIAASCERSEPTLVTSCATIRWREQERAHLGLKLPGLHGGHVTAHRLVGDLVQLVGPNFGAAASRLAV
jgi:hypothetical protein